jgi:hypothetical protein
MADEPENLVLVQLREMRADTAAFREDVSARFENLEKRLALTEAAQGEMLNILKEMAASVTAIGRAQQVTGSRLNSMDQRLALIEEHIGFVKA